jgi:molybdopterin-guanine dinucleotide biosynthesis protein A
MAAESSLADAEPLGAVLAGGAGRRIGGAKATVALHGRPLIAYPLTVLARVLPEVVVVAKADTELPGLPGTAVWIEPDQPRHPLLGIVHALGLAGGRSVLVCAGDMPFVGMELIRRLAADRAPAPAMLAAGPAGPQPLLGVYRPQAGDPLRRMLEADPGVSMRAAAAAIGAATVAVTDEHELLNVNAPEDLLRAAALLDQPNVKS